MSTGIYDRLVNIEDALGELLTDLTDEGHLYRILKAYRHVQEILDDMDQRQESRGQ